MPLRQRQKIQAVSRGAEVSSSPAAPGLPVDGVRLGVAQAGIKKPDHDDLTVMELAAGTVTSAVFTTNAFRAAPVLVAEQHLDVNAGKPAYLVINTGNANAGTGEPGMQAARMVCDAVAWHGSTEATQVLPFSTGVIGEPLPAQKIVDAVQSAFGNLSPMGWERAAAAILTTDTRPKLRSVMVEVEGVPCVITGMSKGSGMICPNMATMLAFIATDAKVRRPVLQKLWREVVKDSFNRITVDGDTSTNDAALVCATGRGALEIADEIAPAYGPFRAALLKLATELAHDIVRDGEGATKFVAVSVEQGESSEECDQIARTIAHSPLVKTALFAQDPNWGRLLAAIGRAGVDDLDVSRVTLLINDCLIAEGGARAASYTEEQGVAAMAPEDITIRVLLARGEASATVWTSDLSYEYVRINADYRT
jgi:glutamate N-acetyltransferase/amino-acid N-acetyltransferase